MKIDFCLPRLSFLILLIFNFSTPVVSTVSENAVLFSNARAIATTWRKKAGEISCKYEGIGVTGGWCLRGNWTREDPLAENHVRADEGVARTILEFLSGKRIYDIGAGVGQYGSWFEKNGPSITWQGFDGAENVEEFTGGFVKWTDATQPFFDEVPGTADWVMSLEVGEHVHAEETEHFLCTLDRHNTQGILLSWAIPGQPGHHHVNNLSNDDVKLRMSRMGYFQDEWCLRFEMQARKAANYSWFRNTFMVFKKRNDGSRI